MILDLKQLLAPISKDNDVGEDLRYDDIYDEIKELRRADDDYLPQGIWETDIKKADWPGVKKSCIEAISTQTKDLQISAWLLEALLHTDGLKGISSCMELILGLCEKYWDNMYPSLGENDFEFRISPLIWINDVVSELLKSIPLTDQKADDPINFSYNEWEETNQKEKLAKQSPSARKKHDAEKKLTLRIYEKSKQGTATEFFQSNLKFIKEINQSIEPLEALLDEKCSPNAPGLTKFKRNLELLATHQESALAGRSSAEDEKNEETMTTEQAPAEVNGDFIRTSSESAIQSRQEAYKMLDKIADFLLEVDPHSPVPYLVKRAVSWGDMELSELLTELLKDGQNLPQLFSLLGIQNLSAN